MRSVGTKVVSNDDLKEEKDNQQYHGDEEEVEKGVYEAPLSFTLNTLKKVSLSSSGVALLMCPMFIHFGNTEKVSFGAGMILVGSLGVAGLASTGFIHMCFNPYVHKMTFDAQNDTYQIEKRTLFGRKYTLKPFKVEEMTKRKSFNPFSNFHVQGEDCFSHHLPRLYPGMEPFYNRLSTILDDVNKKKSRPIDPHDENII